MLEIFSPFYLWRSDPFAGDHIGLFAQHAIWFIAATAAIETLVHSAERFIADSKGRSLLQFQFRTVLEIGLTYTVCLFAMHTVWTRWLGGSLALDSFAGIAGLAVLPRVYAVFGLLPYVGRTFLSILNVWSLVLLFLALRAGLDLQFIETLAVWAAAAVCYLLLRAIFRHWSRVDGKDWEDGVTIPPGGNAIIGKDNAGAS